MCTAGIGARAPGLMKSAEASDRIIAINGCPVNCASKTLELAGFKVDRQIVISELGIKKSKEKDLKDQEVADTLGKVMLLPPFGVLLTKWVSMEAASNNPVVIIFLVLGSALTTVYYSKWLGTILSSSMQRR